MKKSPYQKTAEILSNGQSQLGFLLAKADALRKIDAVLAKILPEQMTEHCHACNIKQGRLIIATESAHWLTRLRYLKPELLSQLRSEHGFAQITGIDCKVSPKLATIKQPAAQQQGHTLSLKSKASIKKFAESLDDPQLREKLRQLTE